MITARTRSKLDEARFFLEHLRAEKRMESPGSSRAFGFYLSAFLNAAYSVGQYLAMEAKTELKRGAGRKKQAKKLFESWRDRWVVELSVEERQLWNLMEEQRGRETHRAPAETFVETKAVPYEPRLQHRGHPAYHGAVVVGPPPLFADTWIKNRRQLGLPSWATAWWEAQDHYFEIESERRDVVQTCERYVGLLEKFVRDFEASQPLAT